MIASKFLRSPVVLQVISSQGQRGAALASQELGFRLTNIRKDRCLSTSAAAFAADKVLEADNFLSWKTDVPVKLRTEKIGPGSWEPKLVQSVMRRTSNWLPDNTALAIKRNATARYNAMNMWMMR